MHIGIVNHSTLVTDHDVARMTRAVAFQVHHHAAPAWDRSPAAVIWYPKAQEGAIAPGTHIIAVMDDPDQQGVLGWHTEDNPASIYGRVFARPSLDNGGHALSGDWSVASVLSHEVLEMFVDPGCNLQAYGGHGISYDLEVCDPVEAPTYNVPTGTYKDISLSNFVLPSWFDPNAGTDGPFDYLGLLTAPFTMLKGGYMVTESNGKPTQHFGDEYPSWRKASKKNNLARTARRLRQHG